MFLYYVIYIQLYILYDLIKAYETPLWYVTPLDSATGLGMHNIAANRKRNSMRNAVCDASTKCSNPPPLGRWPICAALELQRIGMDGCKDQSMMMALNGVHLICACLASQEDWRRDGDPQWQRSFRWILPTGIGQELQSSRVTLTQLNAATVKSG